MGEIYQLLIVKPVLNVLIFYYHALTNWRIPYPTGFAVILLVSTVRIILNPVYRQQLRLQEKMNLLKPHLDALNTKHKNDKAALQKAQLDLYKEHNFNPASGCLSALIQMPLMLGLFSVLTLFLSHDAQKALESINSSLYFTFMRIISIDPHFFVFDLSKNPSTYATSGWFYLLVPLVTGTLQYFQISLTTPASTPKTDKDAMPDFGSQMKIFFPISIAFASFNLPVGLALYWNMMSIFGIISARKSKKLQIITK